MKQEKVYPNNLKLRVKGFTLVETVVFLGVFGVLAILSTSTLFLVLGNMAKARVTQDVRRNGNNALQVMERQLRVAKAVDSCLSGGAACTSGCDTVKFTDQYGSVNGEFSCKSLGPDLMIIASSSGQPLTDQDSVNVSSCSFSCDASVPTKWVNISFTIVPQTQGSSRATDQFRSDWHSQVNIRFQ